MSKEKSSFGTLPNEQSMSTMDPDEKIRTINAQQFKVVSQLFNDYYDIHEPKHEKFEAIKELKKRLNRKKVLNINVIGNEKSKIKKDRGGKGALIDKKMHSDDSNMMMFSKELTRLLLLPNKEDKFMAWKVSNAKKRRGELKTKANNPLISTEHSDSDDAKPTMDTIAEEEVDSLRLELTRILSNSPKKSGQMRRATLLTEASISDFNFQIKKDMLGDTEANTVDEESESTK